MAKYRVEFRDDKPDREVEADTFTEMDGSYNFIDRGTNQVIASIPRELVLMVTKVDG